MSNNFFKWDKEFNTGNTTIDEQHFKLVEMVNELLEVSINNNTINISTITTMSNKLNKYIQEHFSTEEIMMKNFSIDSRHSKKHFQYHKDFVEEIKKQFSTPHRLQNPKNFNDIIEYLIRWLAYHILNTDKSLVRQINYIIDDNLNPSDAYEKEEQIIESSSEPLLKALKVLYLLVSKKNKEIRRKNIELEEKVRIRTIELTETNKKLNHMLFQDTLTELPNRRFLMDELQKLIFNWERYEVTFSILFIDIDKFKSVNDNYGHEYGDKVLKWIATFLKNNIRKNDIACRIGGDEFVIICPHTNIDGAISIGKKLNKLCTSENNNQLSFWKPSLSIGVASVNNSISSPSEILSLADSAMYKSKTKGGNLTSIS